MNKSCIVLLLLCGLTPFLSAQDSTSPHGGMLRYPDVSVSQITFVYADDVWVVSKDGGTAQPLASPDGGEMFPRFSPDGKTIAFNGNYDGNNDIYTVPVNGGIPHRVTYHSYGERLSDWTADGKIIFAMNGVNTWNRLVQLFTVDAEGGLPEQLPVPYGSAGVISPNGEWLIYTPHNRDFRTWKRYRGGWASDIWMFNLNDHSSKQITDWEGTDTIPMWHNNAVYYLSDAGSNHRLNIWKYDIKTEERQQITHFREYDIKWPSNGPGSDGEGEIVFENNGKIYLLNLQTQAMKPIDIQIPGAKPNLRPIRKDVSSAASNWEISPSGKRVLVSARGDVWSLPAKNGSPRNLTQTSGIAEREPTWSPDGKWISYISDESGENQLVIQPVDGSEEPTTLTTFNLGYYSGFQWSPDSKKIVFIDHEERFHLLDIESKETKEIDRINISGWGTGMPFKISWSHDSRWLVYPKPGMNSVYILYLYSVDTGEVYPITNGMFWDGLPTFDRKGDFLYFASAREISNPDYADIGYAAVFNDTMIIHAMPLRSGVSNPLKPKSDEEIAKAEEKEDEPKEKEEKKSEVESDDSDSKEKSEKDSDDDSDDDSKKEDDSKSDDKKDKDEVEPIVIELDGMESRAFRLPIARGGFNSLEVNDQNQLIYRRTGDDSKIQLFDPFADKKEEKTVLDDAFINDITPDGTKLLVTKSGKRYIIDAKADQKAEDAVITSPMRVQIDPREEWKQIFTDAWRFMRDYFYDPNMHEVDWQRVRKQYEAMLADCVSRRDLNFVIGEMISEVNAGHTYRGGGDTDSGPGFPIGYMGADFVLDQGYYKVSKFHQGGEWDTDARPFIHQLDQKQRDAFQYVFEVNGVPIDTNKAPWAAFEGYSGETVTLTVGASPNIDEATKVVVNLLSTGQDSDLRYRDWVESNRQYVAEKSGGKVGYIHVPNTADWGQRELWRQFYGQMNTEALIVDERWNGGGNIADRYVELLNRPIYLHIFERYENDWRVPGISHQGPKCMLINQEAGSGGDIFPYLFRKAGVGKLIGKRTWGGVIGIAKNPGLIDGGYLTVPFITFYETDGTLTMEGHGVDPDIEVEAEPALMVDGSDPQLDAAIKHMLEEIETNPYVPAKRPPYPNRRGMGILEENK